jgi:putative transferase (TIGR04331 family)
MHSICSNDNFKIYIAETKKVGSKYIYVVHGGGLTFKFESRFDFFEKVSNKIIRWAKSWSTCWDDKEQNQDIYADLSPTLPTIKLKDSKIGNDCTILSYEPRRYANYFMQTPTMEQEIDSFSELMQFVDKLNPEIKSKVKFRVKGERGYNYVKRFSEIFGEKKIDKLSINNPLSKTLLNSKLIIAIRAETSFSEAMHVNIPTILIIKKNHWQFSKTSLDTFEVLKKNRIAFDNFNEAKNHINKHWKELRAWWNTENVQFVRKIYLSNFYNVKADWYKEWSDYIYFSKQL